MEQKRKWFFGNKDRPDAEAEDTTPTLSYFFKLLWRKAGKLLSLNLLVVLQFIPLVVALLVFLLGPTTPTVESPLYAPLMGASMAGGSPAANLMLGIFGQQLDVPVLSTGRAVVIIVMLSLTALTWGWQNVGAGYNLRSLVRGDSCFLLSDYFYAIRRNLKQGFFFGILDFAFIALILFDIFFFYPLSTDFLYGFMYIIVLIIGILYVCMRFYIFPMMITFDLSIRKLLKNALIFTMLGIKRNLVALLGIAAVIALNIMLIVGGLSIGFSVPIILPFFYLPALLGFIGTYAAYPNIKRYMIDPYLEKNGTDATLSTDAEENA